MVCCSWGCCLCEPQACSLLDCFGFVPCFPYRSPQDVHSRFRTEAHKHVVARFNERFILSLASNPSALVLDDELNVLPVSRHSRSIVPVPRKHGADADVSLVSCLCVSEKRAVIRIDSLLLGEC